MKFSYQAKAFLQMSLISKEGSHYKRVLLAWIFANVIASNDAFSDELVSELKSKAIYALFFEIFFQRKKYGV
ncbi:MAG: hypothetical protein QM709_12105 [Spongiibacteraceae bacterium]